MSILKGGRKKVRKGDKISFIVYSGPDLSDAVKLYETVRTAKEHNWPIEIQGTTLRMSVHEVALATEPKHNDDLEIHTVIMRGEIVL